jgi:hypothetical protein
MAQTYARLGVMRLNNARLNYFQPWFKVLINGVDRTANVRIQGASITHLLNHEPDTATLRVDGFAPTKGHEVKVYMGDTTLSHQLFGGHILDVQTTHEQVGDNSNVVYDLSCIDYTILLNRRKVLKKYTSQSASTIVADLISTFSSGFTTNHVVSGLATIDEITFTNEDLTDALTRVAERIGGYWFADYAKDVHFFLTNSESAGTISDASPRTSRKVVQSVDLSQVATRILCTGGGAQAATDCAVGQTTIPVTESSWYSASGGSVQSGPQKITYTGVDGGSGTGSTTGYILPPASAGTVTANTAGSLALGTYRVAMTYTTADGETTPSVYQTVTLTGVQDSIFVDSMPVPADARVTTKTLYVSDTNGSTLKKYTDLSVSATSNEITTSGTTAAPSENTAGFGTEETAAGSTTLPVEELASFPSSGWAEVNGQVFRYTGRSASSGAGTLTGIPASGEGSLTAPVRAGTVKIIPHLTGVPSSGTGSIVYAISKGDEVSLRSDRNDTTAQTAMAGFIGGDGIHEDVFSDGRLSLTELNNRGDAILAERKDPLTSVSLETRDAAVAVGKTITFSLTNPPVSGTYRIQRVVFSELAIAGTATYVLPLRTVDCSSKRYSFEDLLRQISRN